MHLIVVRHAQAAPKKSWARADDERPLVARGRRQAERLGKVIGDDRPSRLISSPARRCVETVQPYAEKAALPVELSNDLSTDAGPAALELCRHLLATEPADAKIVLCTHREVLIELLPWLSEEFGVKLGHRLPGAKGGAWFLRWRGRKLQKVDYRPPAA